MKEFLIKCAAVFFFILAVLFMILGVIVMCFAFCTIPFIWFLARIGFPWAIFNEREISLGPFVKFTLNPKN